MVQTAFVSQHPVHVVAQLGLPASMVGALQILIGSVGAAAIGPHVSPRVKQSAVDVQSWSGPIAVVGHGPSWQAVVIMIVAQHTSPRRHVVEVVHVTPDAPLLLLELPPPLELPPTEFPPLLALPPTIDPLLDPPPPPLDPPLLELGLATGTAFASSLPASGTVSSLPPQADRARAARAATGNADPRRALIFTWVLPVVEDDPGDYYLSVNESPLSPGIRGVPPEGERSGRRSAGG
jgi:hypothetical protein